jgi:ketosteroid isomerase-like protein
MDNLQRSWTHCSTSWTANRVVTCPSCSQAFEFVGQPKCPLCQLGFVDGVPLAPYLKPASLFELLLTSRKAARETQRLRAEAEFNTLYASWSLESTGSEQICADARTRFHEDLRAVVSQHQRLLADFSRDLEKFLYSAPIRLAKFEAEYSWKFDQELGREIDQILEGMLQGKLAIPVSLGFLARYRQRFPLTYSRSYLTAELKHRYNVQRQFPRPGFQLTLDYARTLSGLEFEEWLARLLRDAGIPGVVITQASRDQGADLVITVGPRKIVMQAKQCQDTIGNSAVQQVHGALPYYDATEAWVVTTSSFSKDAIDLAFRTGVRLVSGNQLLNLPATLRGTELTPEPQVTAYFPERTPPAVESASGAQKVHDPEPAVLAVPAAITSPNGLRKPRKTGEFRIVSRWTMWQIACLGGGIALLSLIGWVAFTAATRHSTNGQSSVQSQIAAEEEIRDLLQDYQKAEFNRDAAALAQCYAPTVRTFYMRYNVSRSDVQKEFERIFAGYTEVHSMKISDLAYRDVTPVRATADFEKSWDLRGAKNYAGAEREEMVFQKIDGSWRIASERELTIYWTKRGARPARDDSASSGSHN